ARLVLGRRLGRPAGEGIPAGGFHAADDLRLWQCATDIGGCCARVRAEQPPPGVLLGQWRPWSAGHGVAERRHDTTAGPLSRGSTMRLLFLLGCLAVLVPDMVAAQDSTAANIAGGTNYLEPGDVIRLRVWPDEKISGEYRVDTDGM